MKKVLRFFFESKMPAFEQLPLNQYAYITPRFNR